MKIKEIGDNSTIQYIYCILQNNTPIYVGQTKEIKYRILSHIERFGIDIEVMFLQTNEYNTKFFSYDWEQYWINQLVVWGFDLKNIQYNPKHNYKPFKNKKTKTL